MTKTFRATTSNGNKVLFTVLKNCGGCMFTIRAAAQDVCDEQGWTLDKALWM